MKELNIINNPQFDLRYFERGKVFHLLYKKNEYNVMTRALLVSSSPFVLTFRIMTDDYHMISKEIDVPVDQYVNRLVDIYKVVI